MLIGVRAAALCPNRGVTTGCYTAQHAFTGEAAHEVSFSMGEVITVLDMSGNYDGWWHGAVGEKTGWFPAAYVKCDPCALFERSFGSVLN